MEEHIVGGLVLKDLTPTKNKFFSNASPGFFRQFISCHFRTQQMIYLHSVNPNTHGRFGVHACSVTGDVDFSRPLFGGGWRGVTARRRCRGRRWISVHTASFCDVVLVVVVVVVDVDFENSLRSWKKKKL